jgi:hypothetical protein
MIQKFTGKKSRRRTGWEICQAENSLDIFKKGQEMGENKMKKNLQTLAFDCIIFLARPRRFGNRVNPYGGFLNVDIVAQVGVVYPGYNKGICYSKTVLDGEGFF